MSKKNSGANNNPQSKSKQTVSEKKGVVKKNDFFDFLDNYFLNRKKAILFIGLTLTLIFSSLLFDVKVGPGGDDSAYVLRAYDFVHSFMYPGYQGALYPILLSPFILLFGVKIAILKLLSLVFMVVAMYFFYKAFSGKIPQLLLVLTFILLCFNYYVLYFASQTYSEAFFLMLQAIFFWYLSRHFISTETQKNLKHYLVLGFLLFLLSLTKNIAVAAVFAVAGFFLLNKQWKNLFYTVGSFTGFFLLFEFIKRLIWSNAGLQFAQQGSGLMYKDFYNPSKGTEDFVGFINRFIDNSNIYFSKYIFCFLGFKPDITEITPFLTVLTWALIIIAAFLVFKKNKLLLFTAIYTAILCTLSFLAIQAKWDQWRIIIIAFPFVLLLLFSAFYYLLKDGKLKLLQILFPILPIIIFFTSFKVTVDKVKVQKDILTHNLDGDLLYGLTPDWENYIKMSQWAAENTPKESFTAVRKDNISFIYTGRKFVGVTKVISITADSLLKLMPDTNMVYIGINYQKLDGSDFFANPAIKDRIVGFVNGDMSFESNEIVEGSVVGIFKFSVTEFPQWEEKLKQKGIYYNKNVKSWIKNIDPTKTNYSIYIPDILLNFLKKSKVKYIMLASLRMDPRENNGSIITTMQRYVFFIQMKYPNLFGVVHTIGTDENAQLIELLN